MYKLQERKKEKKHNIYSKKWVQKGKAKTICRQFVDRMTIDRMRKY